MLLDGKRILIVEDDVLNLSVFSTILRKEGATVYQDALGHQTEVLYKYIGRIDIILLDLMLDRSNTSGYDLFDKLRNDTKLEDVPIVLVTASEGALKKAKEKGFNGFIGKPLDRKTFAKHIVDILDGQSVWVVPEPY